MLTNWETDAIWTAAGFQRFGGIWTADLSGGGVLAVQRTAGGPGDVFGATIYATADAYRVGLAPVAAFRAGSPDELLAAFNAAGLDWTQPDNPDTDPERCPGCGCYPGDGRTGGCVAPNGCGFYPF